VSNYDIASILATSVSERLVRRVCTECRREREFNEQEKEIITKIMAKYGEEVNFDELKTYDAVGCKHCNNTGYYNRIGIFEVLDKTDEIKNIIIHDASRMEMRKKALDEDYRPLVLDGIRKVLDGITTLSELNNKILIY